MPFMRPSPPPPPPRREPQPRDGNGDRTPLLRLGGLWPNKNGNALMGNTQLDYTPKDSDQTRGEQLIKLIEDCMEQGVPLRFLVFENNKGFPKNMPYTINVTVGQPRPGDQAPREEAETVPDWVTDTKNQMPIAEPTPIQTERVLRPIRRSAPRR